MVRHSKLALAGLICLVTSPSLAVDADRVPCISAQYFCDSLATHAQTGNCPTVAEVSGWVGHVNDGIANLRTLSEAMETAIHAPPPPPLWKRLLGLARTNGRRRDIKSLSDEMIEAGTELAKNLDALVQVHSNDALRALPSDVKGSIYWLTEREIAQATTFVETMQRLRTEGESLWWRGWNSLRAQVAEIHGLLTTHASYVADLATILRKESASSGLVRKFLDETRIGRAAQIASTIDKAQHYTLRKSTAENLLGIAVEFAKSDIDVANTFVTVEQALNAANLHPDHGETVALVHLAYKYAADRPLSTVEKYVSLMKKFRSDQVDSETTYVLRLPVPLVEFQLRFNVPEAEVISLAKSMQASVRRLLGDDVGSYDTAASRILTFFALREQRQEQGAPPSRPIMEDFSEIYQLLGNDADAVSAALLTGTARKYRREPKEIVTFIQDLRSANEGLAAGNSSFKPHWQNDESLSHIAEVALHYGITPTTMMGLLSRLQAHVPERTDVHSALTVLAAALNASTFPRDNVSDSTQILSEANLSAAARMMPLRIATSIDGLRVVRSSSSSSGDSTAESAMAFNLVTGGGIDGIYGTPY